MINSERLGSYCKKMFLNFSIKDDVLILQNKSYEIVDDDLILFDEDLNFSPISNKNIFGFVYELCGRWYLQEKGVEVTMTPLSQIGEPNINVTNNSFLGIHSGNELLNGVGLYGDWINKASFLNIKYLGICEKNSVSGSMDFQKKCLKKGIKPIVGMSITIQGDIDEYSVKCYAKDFQGWQNLLKFSYILNVDGELTIKESFLKENLNGLFVIIDPKNSSFKEYDFIHYFQLDTVIFDEEAKDIEFSESLEMFLNSNMKPILLNDAYCIEESDWIARESLWGIAKSFDYKSKNQYFKNSDEILLELKGMFDDDNYHKVLFEEAKDNLDYVADNCNFQIDTTSRHLPKYVMTSEEKKLFKTNEELFMHLIEKGFKDRGIDKENKAEYIKRIITEIDVLKKGDVIDYFLMTRDIIQDAKSKDILVGVGRGSAGGCLVSYLLDIIQLDPIKFELIFERFLNKGRMGELKECDAYEIHTDSEVIKLNEKSILHIDRNGTTMNVFAEDLKNDDKIIRY